MTSPTQPTALPSLAIGIHHPMGHLSFSHLLPAYIGASIYLVGIFFYRPAPADKAVAA